MTLIQLLVVSILVFTVVGCSDSSYSNPQDKCNDQAWDECADIARGKCNLSSTSTVKELRACRPYAQCDDAAFDACMDEHE